MYLSHSNYIIIKKNLIPHQFSPHFVSPIYEEKKQLKSDLEIHLTQIK